MCGEGDVPERNVVVGEPRPPVHRLVQRSVRRVVLRLGEGALLRLKRNSACFIRNFLKKKIHVCNYSLDLHFYLVVKEPHDGGPDDEGVDVDVVLPVLEGHRVQAPDHPRGQPHVRLRVVPVLQINVRFGVV